MAGPRGSGGGVSIEIDRNDDGSMTVSAEFGAEPVLAIALRWSSWRVDGLVLKDAWERTYGDAGWFPVDADRTHPWYWASTSIHSGVTDAVGVRVGAAAFCSWSIDGTGVTLWLDVRNGGSGLRALGRRIDLASIVRVPDAGSSYDTVVRLCAAMNPAGRRRIVEPIIGNNDWYYTYGVGRDQNSVIRDAAILSGLVGDLSDRPFAVVDCGWSPGSYVPGGPYLAGEPGRFDDMPGLVGQIRDEGARAGIWIRPTATIHSDSPYLLRGSGSTREDADDFAIDITAPGALEQVRTDVSTVTGWGYELVKYDFSTFDLFGRFHPSASRDLTRPGWHLADRTRTNAEILTELYATIADAAGDALLLGCNTVGHLAAPYVDIQRTGDDTSGRDWAITRKMGVNSLAFRLPQHESFFTVDADCVPCTPETDWNLNRQFLDVVARTGTALFVSLDPAELDARARADLSAAMRLSAAVQRGEIAPVRPLNWESSLTPDRWGPVTYDWSEDPRVFVESEGEL